MAYAVAYSIFSSTLLVANKWALSFRNTPNALVVYQSIATWCFMFAILLRRKGRKMFLSTDDTPFKNRSSFIWFVIATALQSLTIGSNLNALFHLGVDRVILLRVCAMFPIALGDWAFNNRALPSSASWLCFVTLGFAASFVFGTEHQGLSFVGFVWGCAYFVLITIDQVALKRFTQSVPMNNVDRTFWMNGFGAIVSSILAAIYIEPILSTRDVSGEFLSAIGYFAIALSCLLGAGISFTAWGLRERSSALTFSLIGLVCKIGSMALNFFVLDHVRPLSIVIISLGIASTWFYEQAPEIKLKNLDDVEGEGTSDETKVFFNTASNPVSGIRKRAFIILLLVVFLISVENQPGYIFNLSTDNATVSATNNNNNNNKYHGHLPMENRNYSWSRCVGSTQPPEFWRYRSCYLKAVCYTGNPAGSLTYFAHLDDDVTSADLMTSTMVPYANDVRAPAKVYNVEIAKGPIPVNAHWPYRNLNAGERTPVVAPVDFFIPAVWTHLLLDNIFPLFRLLEIFDIGHDLVDVRPHSLSDPCPENGYRDGCGTTDRRYNPEWVKLINSGKWNYDPIQTSYTNWGNSSMVCFDHVLTGPSLFSDHGIGWSEHGRRLNEPVWTNWGISYAMWTFRNYTMQRAKEISGSGTSVTDYTDMFYDVVFTLKGKSAFSDNPLNVSILYEKLKETLSARLDFVNVTIGYPVYLEKYSVHQQMQIMSKAKLVISQVGSTSYGAMWLPKGATLILLYQTEKLDYYFWDNLAWLRAIYLQCDSPANENQTDAILKTAVAGLTRAFSG